MRAVAQRVTSASVEVEGETVGRIERGLLVYLGAAALDGPQDLAYVANKLAGLRIFEDESGKMARSVADVGGQVLVVSQFTLFGDVRRGRRPSFDGAAPPAEAERLYRDLVGQLRALGLGVETGRFRAHMRVNAAVDGPVTILIDSRKLF
jgi:D-tyrosyl-tRNA(Tyr) deacylase